MLAAASVGSAAAAAAGLEAKEEAEVENWTQQELRVQSHDVAEDDRKVSAPGKATATATAPLNPWSLCGKAV